MLATVLLFGLSLLAFASIGILSATITLVFKRGESALSFFVSLSWLPGARVTPTHGVRLPDTGPRPECRRTNETGHLVPGRAAGLPIMKVAFSFELAFDPDTQRRCIHKMFHIACLLGRLSSGTVLDMTGTFLDMI